MSEDKLKKDNINPRAKMLEALARKQKGHNEGRVSCPTGGSKIGAGQAGGIARKMHRRKAGSA